MHPTKNDEATRVFVEAIRGAALVPRRFNRKAMIIYAIESPDGGIKIIADTCGGGMSPNALAGIAHMAVTSSIKRVREELGEAAAKDFSDSLLSSLAELPDSVVASGLFKV